MRHSELNKSCIIANTKRVKGIFCNDSAGYCFGWGTIIPAKFHLLSAEADELTKTPLCWYHPTKDMINNLIDLPSVNKITNEDRSILELMDFNPYDEFTAQFMEDYGIDDKLEHLREFNNQWNYCSNENFELALQCYNEYMEDPH